MPAHPDHAGRRLEGPVFLRFEAFNGDERAEVFAPMKVLFSAIENEKTDLKQTVSPPVEKQTSEHAGAELRKEREPPAPESTWSEQADDFKILSPEIPTRDHTTKAAAQIVVPEIVQRTDHTVRSEKLLLKMQAEGRAGRVPEQMAPPEKGQWATYADYYEKLIPEMQARVRVGMTPEQIAALEKARADRLNYGHFTPCSTIRRR